MADTDEMTPAKWGLVGGTILVIVVAVVLIYRAMRPPAAASVSSMGDKSMLLQEATGSGQSDAPQPAAREGDEEEPQSLKGRGATRGGTNQ